MSVIESHHAGGFYEPHYVYAVLCQDDDGPLYIKFGKTMRLHKRLREVAQGSPIKARWFAFLEIPAHRQRPLEKKLHETFEHRKTRGEWFKFDANSKEDVREFNDGSRRAFKYVLFKDASWGKISVAALDRYARERQMKYLRAKNGRKLNAANARKKAWRELRDYGQ